MSIWLFRAGKQGEYENKFLQDKRVYLTCDNLNTD
ncbi:restriction system protein [Thalassobacillus cyri]|uniref:Restriction system protein n=1 Tax=Thalassobacillus cyri TaxID=571932 RepID=A0A1H3VXS4_9BACI|nr:restriction system protein [Thalassobacillus cyri]